MAIKSGQFLHDAYGFVVDRIQTGGVGSLSVPEEKIYELGNFNSVATVRDTPELSFDVESYDMSTEFEALLTFADPLAAAAGTEYDLSDAKPLDIISPFKTATGLYTTPKGVIVPYLTLEQSTYRFAVRQSATQQHTLRGDSYFFVDGSPYYEEFSGDGLTGNFALGETAIEYNYSGDTIHCVGVCVVFSDGTYKRLFYGDHYTDTSSQLTILDPATDAPSGSTIKVVYGSATVASYPQTVHQNVSTKPAAVRAKDIDIYVGDAAATPTFTRWSSVQSAEVTRRVNLDRDEEFGNPFVVGQDYDVPEVSGSVTVRPRDLDDLWDKVYQVADVPAGEIAGPLTSVALPVEIRVSDEDGNRLKTLYIPDARFTIPGLQGRVQQKLEVQFNFASDGGSLLVYNGNRFGT